MYKGRFSKSPRPENISKWFQIWKAWDLDFFLTVLSCFALACSIKNRMNISADPHHFPSWDDPFARILELWFSIPSQGSKALPWLWSCVSRKIYWRFLTTQSWVPVRWKKTSLQGHVSWLQHHLPLFLVHFWLSEQSHSSARFQTLLVPRMEQWPLFPVENPPFSPLTSLSWSLKLVLRDQICWEAMGAEPRRNKKGTMWCTGISWLYLSHEISKHSWLPEDRNRCMENSRALTNDWSLGEQG